MFKVGDRIKLFRSPGIDNWPGGAGMTKERFLANGTILTVCEVSALGKEVFVNSEKLDQWTIPIDCARKIHKTIVVYQNKERNKKHGDEGG